MSLLGTIVRLAGAVLVFAGLAKILAFEEVVASLAPYALGSAAGGAAFAFLLIVLGLVVDAAAIWKPYGSAYATFGVDKTIP